MFIVKFASDQTRTYNSVIIGKPKLIADKKKQLSSHEEEKDIGMVACYLKGRTFRPHLHLDKLLTL